MRVQDLIKPCNGGKTRPTPNSPTENLFKMSGKVRRVSMLINVGHGTKLILNPNKAFNLSLNVYTSHYTHLLTLM